METFNWSLEERKRRKDTRWIRTFFFRFEKQERKSEKHLIPSRAGTDNSICISHQQSRHSFGSDSHGIIEITFQSSELGQDEPASLRDRRWGKGATGGQASLLVVMGCWSHSRPPTRAPLWRRRGRLALVLQIILNCIYFSVSWFLPGTFFKYGFFTYLCSNLLSF